MKKTVRNIIIMLVVLAVLGGAVALVTLMPQESGGEESSSAPSSSELAESVDLIDYDHTAVKSILVENAQGSFTFVPVKNGDTIDFTIEGLEDQDLNTSLISSNVQTLLGMASRKDLGSRDDLASFGLGSDAPVVTIQHTGGTDRLILGSDAGETVGKYVWKDDSVYIVSGVPASLYQSKFTYFNTSIYSIPDKIEVITDEEGNQQETTGLDTVSILTLSGTAFPKPITIESSSVATSGYLVTAPIKAESGNTYFEELIPILKALSADSVVAAGLDDQVLEEYGLAEPEAKIEFELNDSEHTIAVSAKDGDGNRYMIADDKDVVYQVAASTVEKWAECTLSKLRMSYIWIPNIKNVETLTVTVNGDEVHEYHITRAKNEEKSTETNTQYDITSIVDENGSEVSYDDAYQPFYQELISLAVFSQEDAATSGKAEVKVEYEYFGGGGDTVEFYKLKDQNRYAAVLNGLYNGQIRGTGIADLLEMLP